MELSPSFEASSCSATQEIFSTLRNPKVHWHIQKSPILVPALSVDTHPSHIFKIHFDIILISLLIECKIKNISTMIFSLCMSYKFYFFEMC
jgi:hypothetical protein